jgi:two-component system response regulator PilR (NtrC family)
MNSVTDLAPSVLLVEDDENVRDILSTALQEAGYMLACASTYAEARDAIARRTHDVVVTDIRLPDGLGYNLLAEAKAAGSKVIFITGYVDEIPSVQGRRTSCLMKPFSLDALIDEVEEQIGRRH